jgi:hypothetical protein
MGPSETLRFLAANVARKHEIPGSNAAFPEAQWCVNEMRVVGRACLEYGVQATT